MNCKTHQKIDQSLRGKLLSVMVEKLKPIYRWFLKNSRSPWAISSAQLHRFPTKSLGKDLALFLRKENLELMPLFEEHDIMHVLLGYKNTVLDEARMQFFLLGNGKRTVFVLGACTLSLLLLPEYYKILRQDYRKGKEVLTLSKWDFRHLLYEPTQLLKNLMNREQHNHRPFIF